MSAPLLDKLRWYVMAIAVGGAVNAVSTWAVGHRLDTLEKSVDESRSQGRADQVQQLELLLQASRVLVRHDLELQELERGAACAEHTVADGGTRL